MSPLPPHCSPQHGAQREERHFAPIRCSRGLDLLSSSLLLLHFLDTEFSACLQQMAKTSNYPLESEQKT
jgi:hypothetical protein